MSNYTVSVWRLIESGFDFGLDDYPIFDESYREPLNKKIIDHYYEYEIGSETPDLFKFRLNRAMREIMPYFNELYESKLLTIDPLLSFKRTATKSETKEQTSSSTQNVDSTGNIVTDGTLKNTGTTVTDSDSVATLDNTTTSDKLMIESDMPQDELLVGDIENNLYANSAVKNKDSVVVDEDRTSSDDTTVTQDLTAKNDSSVISTNDTDSISSLQNDESINTTDTEEGFNVSQSELIMQYRASIINIDEEIIEHKKIKTCFMLVFKGV